MKKSISGRGALAAAALLSVVGILPNQLHAQNCVPIPSGLVSWWRAEGDATDAAGSNNGTLLNGTTFAAGEVGQAFQLNGSSQAVRVAASSSLDVGQGSGFTVEAWLKPTDTGNGHPVVEWSPDAGAPPYGVHFYVGHPSHPPGYIFANLADTSGGFHIIDTAAGVAQPNVWQHLALTYDKSSGLARIYLNGVVVSAVNLGTFTPQTSPNLFIGERPSSYAFAGLIDELSLYNRALADYEVRSVYQGGAAGKCTGPTGPFIYVQPADATVTAGQNASFSVVAGGTAPLTYQWQYNGSPLSNQTNASLTIASAQQTDQGSYSVIVSNSVNYAVSSNANLTVIAPAQCAPVPAGIVSWWQGEGNAVDFVGSNNGVPLNGVTFAPGEVAGAFHLNGTSQAVRVPASQTLDVGSGGGLTIEAWVNPTDVGNGHPVAEWSLGSAPPYGAHFYIGHPGHPAGYIFANIVDTSGGLHIIDTTPGVAQANVFQHIAFTYDKASGIARIILNGSVVTEANLGSFTPQTAYDLYLGERPSSPYLFAGLMDEVSLYGRALSVAEVQTIYNAGASGKCTTGVAPFITSQPQNQTVTVGQSTSFSVMAGGSQTLYYQWQLYGTNLDGKTAATLVLNNVQQADAGPYSVLVTNSVNSISSSNATLTVLAAGQCVPAPAGIVSWWRAEGDGLDQIGGNNGTLENGTTFAAGEVGQGFHLDGVNNDVKVLSSASLNVGVAAGFTVETWINPTDVGTGHPVLEWSPDAGGPPYGLQFYVGHPSHPPGYIFANIVDTSGGFHIVDTAVGVAQANTFQHLALTYDKASGSALIYLNGTVVGQASLGNFTPQTTFNLFLGQRPGSYAFAGVMDEVSLYGRALTQNEIQSIYAAGAAGKCVQAAPPFIFAQPANRTALVGQSPTLSVGAGGSPPLSYQWSFNGDVIDGATDSSLTLTNVQITQAGNYSVQVTNAAGSATSSNALLTVHFPPALVKVVSTSAAGGTPVTLPIVLVANGNENALSFSVNFPTSLLSYSSANVGSNASGALMFVNTSQAASGRIGVALSLPTSSNFAAGTQEVVEVTFNAAPVAHSTAAGLGFGDTPTTRQVSDAEANVLPANYTGGEVTIAAVQFEADVSPRPNGDGAVSVTDWVLVGRFVAGLDFPTNNNEFQRADCAPRSTQGDGYLTVSDWVQAGRYAAGLDPLEVAGGPTAPGPNVAVLSHRGLAKTLQSTVRVGSGSFIAGHPATVSVYLDALGTENALGFSLSFDPSIFTYTGAILGTGASGASLTINALQAASGRVAFLVGLQPGATFSAGTKEIVKVNFTTASSASGGTNIALTDQPIRREVDDANASVLPATYVDGTMAVNPPPSLSITQSAQNVTLLWPLWASNFVLQTTADLGSPVNWTNVPGTITVNNNQNSLTVPANATPQFYRLKQ